MCGAASLTLSQHNHQIKKKKTEHRIRLKDIKLTLKCEEAESDRSMWPLNASSGEQAYQELDVLVDRSVVYPMSHRRLQR